MLRGECNPTFMLTCYVGFSLRSYLHEHADLNVSQTAIYTRPTVFRRSLHPLKFNTCRRPLLTRTTKFHKTFHFVVEILNAVTD